MPNHIQNEVRATPEVLAAMLNDKGEITFEAVIPFREGCWPGEPMNPDKPEQGYGISATAEMAVEKFVQAPVKIEEFEMPEDWSETTKKAARAMLESWDKTGYLHQMQFARKKWGTKWDAYSQDVKPDALRFQTAWSAPRPVFAALSALFPHETIRVAYADEDRGSNCAFVTYEHGAEVHDVHMDISDVLSLWRDKGSGHYDAFVGGAVIEKEW